jgi:proline iminopeptidase
MTMVEVDGGVSLHVEDDGSPTAPAVLVLHGGLGLDHVLYRRALTPLADDLRLVFFDQRANGRSTGAEASSITMEQLADDAVAVADALGLDRFVPLGHSYGGFVAQELALRHGDRVRGLVLVDTTPGQLGTGEVADESEQGPPPPPEVLEMMSRGMPSTDAEMEEGMATLFPAYFHRPDRLDLAALGEGTIHRAAAMARGFEVLAGWSSVDRLRSIAAPALIVAGRHDVFTSYPQAYRIGNRLPNAEVVVFDDSGHFPFIEEPDAFFALVRRWLRGVPA